MRHTDFVIVCVCKLVVFDDFHDGFSNGFGSACVVDGMEAQAAREAAIAHMAAVRSKVMKSPLVFSLFHHMDFYQLSRKGG